MLTQGESVEAHALRERGWSVSAIARHLGRDRKTVRAYLAGKREPGQRRAAGADRFTPFESYCRVRFGDDPHLWATTLFDEVRDLGYEGAYQSFTRALRLRGLRPGCEACAAAGTPAEFAVIEHPAGEETQWDWVELPGPPAGWGQGKSAHLLVGALSHSGAWRGVLAESEEQPYLVASLHGVCGRLGGVTRRWRFDRMSTVCHPESGDVTASFAQAAKYYGVIVDVCPSRRGWRKGVVEKANHSAAQRWWRTLPDDVTPAQAQARLDGWCARTGDARRRVRDGQRTTVGALAAAEPLMPLPAAPFPAVIEDARTVSAQALVSWHGNCYSVPPGHGGQQVTVRHRLGAVTLDVVTAAGTVLARHRREPDHAGVVVRDEEHVTALEKKVWTPSTSSSAPRPQPPRPASSAPGSAGPPSPRPGHWPTTTSPPSPARMRRSSASWPRCGSSARPPTCCSSGPRARARPCCRRHWPAPPPKPGTRPCSPPART
jgi:transposase